MITISSKQESLMQIGFHISSITIPGILAFIVDETFIWLYLSQLFFLTPIILEAYKYRIKHPTNPADDAAITDGTVNDIGIIHPMRTVFKNKTDLAAHITIPVWWHLYIKRQGSYQEWYDGILG